MLDHYGDMPFPNIQEASNQIFNLIKQKNKFKIISDEKIMDFCYETYNQSNNNMSLAGWFIFASQEMYNNVKEKIITYEKIIQLEHSTNIPRDITKEIQTFLDNSINNQL